MWTRGLDHAAFDGRNPPEAFLNGILSYRTRSSSPLGYVYEGLKLTPKCLPVDIGTHGTELSFRQEYGNLYPAASLTHHGKPDIDELLTLHARHIPQHGILISV